MGAPAEAGALLCSACLFSCKGLSFFFFRWHGSGHGVGASACALLRALEVRGIFKELCWRLDSFSNIPTATNLALSHCVVVILLRHDALWSLRVSLWHQIGWGHEDMRIEDNKTVGKQF